MAMVNLLWQRDWHFAGSKQQKFCSGMIGQSIERIRIYYKGGTKIYYKRLQALLPPNQSIPRRPQFHSLMQHSFKI
jgi:hypothetical protein